MGISKGFRSGLEQKVSAQLKAQGIPFEYEAHKFSYTKPQSDHKYTPDFVLGPLVVETKGIFDSNDRAKHLLVRAQHPDLDIRFVFSNSKAKLYKGSKTTYADWCSKNGFQYADKLIPASWLLAMKETA